MLLQCEKLTKVYPSPGGSERRVVLDDLSLSVESGQSVAVAGPSGSGKSTLLNIIAALDVPTSGAVIFDGIDLADMDETGRAAFRNREIGLVFQLHHLLPQCTVLENVLVPTLAGGLSGDDALEHAGSLLERVGLAPLAQARPAQLSGGEQQRVAVVRALVNRPRLLLADEPTGSLDRESSDRLADLLLELNREQGVTQIVVTHSERLARRLGAVYWLENGKLAA